VRTTQVVVQGVGEQLAVLAVTGVVLTVEEPVGDLRAWVRSRQTASFGKRIAGDKNTHHSRALTLYWRGFCMTVTSFLT
jgi:hypothetical protein